MRLLAIFLISVLALHAVAGVCDVASVSSYLTSGSGFSFVPKKVDYVIVLDRSGSMEGQKINNVKQAATRLIAELPPTDRAAIISFSNTAIVHQSLTSDHQLLAASVATIDAEYGTKYSPALEATIAEFANSPNERAMIFLSDGRSDYSESDEDLLRLTEQLSRNNVCILTISYALGDEASPLLRDMAEQGAAYGCGEHFSASEQGTELQSVFQQIYRSISSSELLTVSTTFAGDDYKVIVSSKLNGKPVPGADATGCVDAVEIATNLYSNEKRYASFSGAQGALTVPDGEYTHESIARITCGGTCNIAGKDEGILQKGACVQTYVALASYVTGETQLVRITPTGFNPQSVAGRQGTLVVWANSDDVPRRIQSQYFDTVVEPGKNFTYAIEAVGTLLYADPERNYSGSITPLAGTGNDVLLVIDESGSMKGDGIREARDAASKFFGLLSSADRGALITFSQQARVVQGFTSDHETLQRAASTLRSEGATNYVPALKLASGQIPSQRPILIFMSDGVPTDAEGAKAILAQTDVLRKQGWCIMTVGFGQEGAAAKELLTSMAGTDECGAFLYAASGRLTQTFGTIYQLSQGRNDLVFEELDMPRITLRTKAKITTKINTKTGRAVPEEDYACSPLALVQVRAESTTSTLTYEENKYAGELSLHRGRNDIELIASVAATDDPSKAFVGTRQTRVYSLSPLWLILLPLLLATIIYLRVSRSE